jgi:hypothetical protein
MGGNDRKGSKPNLIYSNAKRQQAQSYLFKLASVLELFLITRFNHQILSFPITGLFFHQKQELHIRVSSDH